MSSKKHMVLAAVVLLMSASCDSGKKDAAPQPAQKMAPEAQAPPAASKQFTGTVAETMNAANYTYVLLDTGSEKVWFAGPACVVKVGDRLTLPGSMLKENFTSKTLNRTFEKIYFTETIMAPEGAAVCKAPAAGGAEVSAMPEEGQSHSAAPSGANVDFSGIAKPSGGKTVAEIHAGKKELAGKPVTLRGKVVKFNAEIMGKNWAHVQDGTGAAGANDITVTTTGDAKVGDIVLVQGTVQLDKDFGYGYKYALIIEDATLKKE